MVSGIWDVVDMFAFMLFTFFVLAGLGYAASKYLAG